MIRASKQEATWAGNRESIELRKRSGRSYRKGSRAGTSRRRARRYGIAPNLFYRWKDEAEQGAKAALGGRSAAAAETEKDRRIRQLERTLGRKSLEIEILKNVVGE